MIKWLLNRFRPALDPARVSRVYREYDENRGYRAYHEACQAAVDSSRLSSTGSDGPSIELDERGVTHLPAMNVETAQSLLKELHRRFPIASLKKNKPELVGFQIDDTGFRDQLLDAALSPNVDDCALRYFGSEYRVLWYFVARTEVGGGTASFRWHCDKGPSRHLKLLVYLNDEQEHGGNTEFLELRASTALARIGYLFGPADRRAESLVELLAAEGLAYDPASQRMAAGDAILFQPSCTAHRGISPTRADRYVLTLCLLPSQVPWREALAHGGMIDLRSDEKWHLRADELLIAA